MLTDTTVLDVVWSHASGSLDREVGGVLLGRDGIDAADVRVALPALKAEGHRTHVTFTHEVWEEIHRTVDRDHPDLKIVGWYHSHPGFGIFLSEYDRFIQQNFFSGPQQVALVVDPHAGTLGWFGWEGEDIVLKTEEGPFAEHARRPAPTDAGHAAATGQSASATARRWLMPTAAAAVGLIIGFLGASVQTPVPAEDPQTPLLASELAQAQGDLTASSDALASSEALLSEAQATITGLEQRAETAEAQAAAAAEEARAVHSTPPTSTAVPQLTVRVLAGDTLSALSLRLYGDPSPARLIAANPELGVNPDALRVGQQVQVPVEGGR